MSSTSGAARAVPRPKTILVLSGGAKTERLSLQYWSQIFIFFRKFGGWAITSLDVRLAYQRPAWCRTYVIRLKIYSRSSESILRILWYPQLSPPWFPFLSLILLSLFCFPISSPPFYLGLLPLRSIDPLHPGRGMGERSALYVSPSGVWGGEVIYWCILALKST